MFQQILVGIDNSDIGQYVFESAVSLAKVNNASLLILHVISPLDEQYIHPMFLQPEGVYPSFNTEAINYHINQWEELKQERLNWLASLTNKAISAGVITEFTESIGDPGRLICDLARTWEADLIVVGRRGRSGLSELLLGSVSNYVLHHAPCSVLTVQGQLSHAPTNTACEVEQIAKT
ncbi:universal stress protein [Iningainema tapete]|uniref:Universal stress protein n=1 Tax=Iningainema tapete BLCC-T55 TaxID=2748662 RepID=A0A8J6XN04_9CYAN|nr:universal stress protein [Iningainema tapete]MBD2775976.1 universal stress protein [Iningainema tapete BLCC-T55]